MMKMKKEGVLKRIVLTIALAVGMLSWMGMDVKAEEDQTEVSTWSELCSALKIDGANIKLTANVTYGEGDGANKSANLEIPDDTTVTLDLNGCTIDRGLANSEAVSNGYVIMVYGNLTINDSSEGETGKITGGNDDCNGGGVLNAGNLTLTGGSIIGNNAKEFGGGVYNSGIFTMTGGNIIGNNTVKTSGGGICNNGILTMTGGKITNNNANQGGGVYIVSSRNVFEMTGGSISNNNAANLGGGVFNFGKFEMTGGSITGNNATNGAGGVSNYNSMQIGGSPIITGNVIGGELNNGVYTGGTANNCYLKIRDDKGMITVKEALGTDANIGITLENPDLTTPFAEALTGDTSYNSGKLSADDIKHLTSDNNEYAPTLNNDGKAVLKKTITVSGITAKSKVYDGNKAAELDTSKAVLAGEKDGADLTVTATGTFAKADAGKDIDVIVSGLTLEGEDAYKYILATEGQQETEKADIEARPATITAEAKSKAFGEADPSLTAKVTGVLEGEKLNYTIAREKGENAGEYKITVTLGENPNYNVTKTDAVFTITKPVEVPDKTETPAGQTTSEQKPTEITSIATQTPATIEKGKEVTVEKKGTFEVTSDATSKTNTVTYTAVANTKAKSVTIPNTVTVDGKKYEVTEVSTDALKNSSATTVTIGKNVTTLAPEAFKGSNVKTIIIKSKKLTKQSVKNAFKGLKVKKLIVKVKVGSKKENKKYIKKYKKFFTKKNIGVKAVVK
ncbi:MAG: hypothetical protein K6G76_04190 [Lachnospiraceae bacterium]|nr:hypothetical protein [Lachnospiraceae bacterium]